LYAVGPFTDGIFRKSASVRKYREVKEKLESGGDVNFDDVSVFVCAAVFKVRCRYLRVVMPITVRKVQLHYN